MVLDGELWLGRGKFQDCVSIVRRQDHNEDWREITFRVFDAPLVEGAFEVRDRAYRDREVGLPEHIQRVAQTKCRGPEHLESLMEDILTKGGEGLMAREPRSSYEHGRSHTLLKLKRYRDGDATIIGYQEGKGKHKGRLGALVCKTDEGKEFSVGTGFSDRERENRPPIGARITYRYFEKTRDNAPRFPSFLRVRTDSDL